MKVMKREGGGGRGEAVKVEEKKPSKFKQAFLESVALWYYYFSFFSVAQRQFQKERLILIIRRPFPFSFILFSGGGRRSGACDSFDRPPHLCTRAHVKWSQLWLRSQHTITASGTKGNSEKGKKEGCKLKRSSLSKFQKD